MVNSFLWDARLAFVAAYLLCAAAAGLHALLTKPDPRSAIAWIGLCWLFPLGGPLLYWLFGINRIRKRSAGRSKPGTSRAAPLFAEEVQNQVARVADALTLWPALEGNSLEVLHEGEVAFPKMLEAIGGSKNTIWLATYLFQTDDVGRRFVAALQAAVQRGVAVRVLVDGIGEWYDWPHVVPLLRRAGVPAARFLPPRWFPPRLPLNCRNHRKILLIDAEAAFIGGMNLGGREMAGATGRRMTDIHFRTCGPVLTQLAATFAEDWEFVTGEHLAVAPSSGVHGQSTCRVVTGGPDQDIDQLLLILLTAISSARREILIMTPYFVPPLEVVSALQVASLRGVRVVLVIPHISNLRIIDWATQHWLQTLIMRGVEVHLQEPPFSHAKLFVIDGCYAQIGSANLDTRSLRLNFEISVEVYHADFCNPLAKFIKEAAERVAPLSPESLARQPLLARIRNSLCWLISPYL